MTRFKTNDYRQIFKATSIFGGVQFFLIIITLIRAKVIAYFLGAEGFGLNALFNSPISLISSLTGLGISFSAVRDISQSNRDNEQLSKTYITVCKWSFFLGLLGVLITIILSPLLSKWSFHDTQHTISFIFLSVICLFTALNGAQLAILRGTRNIKMTAKATFYGAVIGLILTLPIYILFGIKAILPALIISSLINLGFSYRYSKKIKIKKVIIPKKEIFLKGKSMAKLGFMVMLGGLIGQTVSYVITLYITNSGGIEQVGLYNAGWSITNQYIGMVFAAMGADYYPKLVSSIGNESDIKKMVNQQAEVGVLIIAPMMISFVVFLPIIIKLLFTESFAPIISFVIWSVIGVIIKATSWSIGYIVLAKGDYKLFFYTELFDAIVLLAANIICYSVWGLEGVGIAFLISYVAYFFLIYFCCNFKYRFNLENAFLKVFSIQLFFSLISFCIVYNVEYPYAYCYGSIILFVSSLYSLIELNKRMNLMSFLKNIRT